MTVYRSHVVGSLLRPPHLLAAREQASSGKITAEDLRTVEDAAVSDAIALQEQAGIDIVTDGEQRRELFFDSLSTVVDGITSVQMGESEVLDAMVGDGLWHAGDDAGGELASLDTAKVLITDKLVRRRSVSMQEFPYTQSHATKPVKVTLPDPSSMALSFWSDKYSTSAYRDVSEAMVDLAEVLRQDIAELAAAGCRYIQLDAPDLTFPINEATFFYEAAGMDKERFLTESVELLNGLATQPGVTFSLHICRGNNQGQWHTSGGYEAIAAEVFPKLSNFEHLFLEYDDERSGGFEPLTHVPDDKLVVLGLVSTKTDTVETAVEIERRVAEAGQFYPRDQLALSPQCGFASAAAGNPISAETQRAKLELVGELGTTLWR